MWWTLIEANHIRPEGGEKSAYYERSVMGFFDRFKSKSKRDSKLAKAALEKEMDGDLARAVTLYREAELFDDAARVLLLRADAETGAEQRIAFAAAAVSIAQGEEMKKKALGRKAQTAFDVLKARGGAFLKSEVLAVAKELEEAGAFEASADAYALAGDRDSEVRALTSAGAIERLEDRLRVSDAEDRNVRDLDLALRKIADLDKTAERRLALQIAKAELAKREDERLSDLVRGIRARLARGPLVDLEVHGTTRRYALGREITIGRGDATIPVASRAVSRKHVRLFRTSESGPRGTTSRLFVQDLDTRNGTTLAGARMTGPMAVGQGLRVELGGEVPCTFEPIAGGSVAIDVAGAKFTAPLGELTVGVWRIDHDVTPDDSFVTLSTDAGGARPFLGEFQLASRIELAVGDELALDRGGAVVLRVVGGHLHEEDTSERGADLL